MKAIARGSAAVGAYPSPEAMPRARELAQRALDIAPQLPEAHAMLGIVAGHYVYDLSEAERRFCLAVTREPLSPHLRQWYGTFFLFATGRADEATVRIPHTCFRSAGHTKLVE